MNRTPWIERKFIFNIPPGWMPNILERLRGTGIRIRELTDGLSEAITEKKHLDKWSIKEHIGHLTDLEALHSGRISDYIFHEPVLRAADMSNLRTIQAGHNSKPLHQLISEFTIARRKFIHQLCQLDDETQQFASLHPRLNVMMKPVDMAFFSAEHDDHHMASIRMILDAL